MEISRDPTSFFVLRPQQQSGKTSQVLFGLLAIINICVCPVPPDDPSFSVTKRHPPRKKPAILAVAAPLTFFWLVSRPFRYLLSPSFLTQYPHATSNHP